jgi:hypothetical protein
MIYSDNTPFLPSTNIKIKCDLESTLSTEYKALHISVNGAERQANRKKEKDYA